MLLIDTDTPSEIGKRKDATVAAARTSFFLYTTLPLPFIDTWENSQCPLHDDPRLLGY
jgi:hypothetical protein